MLYRYLLSTWSWFASDRRGFCLGTCVMVSIILLVYAGGVQASLSLGPGGNFPTFRDVFLYAVSHDDLPSLLVSVALLLVVGLSQERRWGTVVFLALSILTMVFLPLLYTMVLFVLVGEPSRICGYSAVEMALFTAQCRQVTQRRLLRCVPIWLLPWFLLLLCMLLLPGTPALFHFCAISIGHNYNLSFIKNLQELKQVTFLNFIPESAYVSTSARLRLPTYCSSVRSSSSQHMYAAPLPVGDPAVLNHHPWLAQVSFQRGEGPEPLTEAEQLEEQMLRAAMLESLQDSADDAKIEVPKSSVSSLRLQQLEKMGFPTDKAVVALAASKQLDGAISLLIDDRVGEQAVVVSKGKSTQTPQSTQPS